MTDIKEVTGLLEVYVKLEEEIKVLTGTKGMSQDILKESQEYRNFLNISYEIEKYTLNGREIIEIYKSVKNIMERGYKYKEERHNSQEKEDKSKIEDLEEVVSNLKKSKYNLRNLTKDPNNFFNGKIVEEIKKEN